MLRQENGFQRGNRKFCGKKIDFSAEIEKFAPKKSISTLKPKILAQKNRPQSTRLPF
jgi:hypothetical protein